MESGFLKTALFALCAALIILIFMPKDCAKQAAHPIEAIKRAKEAKPKGLQIESSTPPPHSREVAWPAGLDAAQLQYMIEIDARFAAPKTMFCPKQERPPGSPGSGNRRLVDALLSLNYIEKRPDGSYAFTNDGLLHMTATDEGSSWSIPVAKRQYVRTDAIECPAADQCNVGFTWQFQPNEIGQAMKPEITPHSGAAKIVGGPGGWVLSDVSQLDAEL
jgi:hypothetical protein